MKKLKNMIRALLRAFTRSTEGTAAGKVEIELQSLFSIDESGEITIGAQGVPIAALTTGGLKVQSLHESQADGILTVRMTVEDEGGEP